MAGFEEGASSWTATLLQQRASTCTRREREDCCCSAVLRAERDDASLQEHGSIEDEDRAEHRDGESHIATDTLQI